MPTSDAERDHEREWFFSFYRQRAANAAALPGLQLPTVQELMRASAVPDLHVLVAAGLDSLARHWQAAFQIDAKITDARRMGLFLEKHADPRIFAKCAAPHLLLRARRAGSDARSLRVMEEIGRYLGNEGVRGAVRTWEDDPDMSKVIADPKVQATGATEAWLRKSQYGELIYYDYRCMWLHEFRQSPDWGSEYADDAVLEPRYENLTRFSQREAQAAEHLQRPVFPRAFMLKTYADAIESFYSECKQMGVSPRPAEVEG